MTGKSSKDRTELFRGVWLTSWDKKSRSHFLPYDSVTSLCGESDVRLRLFADGEKKCIKCLKKRSAIYVECLDRFNHIFRIPETMRGEIRDFLLCADRSELIEFYEELLERFPIRELDEGLHVDDVRASILFRLGL